MGRRILNQSQMQEARRSIAFCYLCGQSLPPSGPGRRKLVTGEHIIPRTFLGPPPSKAAERWSAELDVHRLCEQTNKQRVDHWLKILQDIHNKPASDWPKPGHIRSMPGRPGVSFLPGASGPIPAFSGLLDVFDGVKQWIQGLHACLYHAYLWPDIHHLVLPPVPAFSSEPSGPPLQATEGQSQCTRTLVELATSKDKWNGLIAWGSAIQYRCVWWQCAALAGRPDWICFWTLRFPGVEDWSRHILGVGNERPWHGYYVLEKPPQAGGILVGSDFP